jgi:hypothetical protein
MRKIFSLVAALWTMNIWATVPKSAHTFDFNIQTIQMSHRSEAKIDRAIDLLRQVISSEDFRDQVLNHRYLWRRTFVANKGLSNHQIYELILKGAETIYPYANNTMDLEVQMFTDLGSNVLGYTKPKTRRVWLNSKYFFINGPAKLAGILVHEWLHKLGFDHDYEFTLIRRFSVPYAIGYIVRDLAQKIEDEDHRR